ncbi:glycosyltransferase family 4 protein [Iodobacter sp. HSC-16F04]|uniref:Glycosyltransferase family 4 protein n=1 Tax=Iodobacter violaceini TaxID=3044271 RepID=A0ABX0KUW7_9NEIS|nr:glycosyltransferase family 4 protein [Iodobacter violacea]NHQ88508.1 glycosyltransferase family 4 protein [Iodobacter violacea]
MGVFHYFAPVNFIEYEKLTGFKLLVGAASRKVIAVCEAMNLVGINSQVTTGAVTGGSPECGRGRYLPSATFTHGSTTIQFLPSFGLPGLNRILAAFGYLKTALFNVEPSDKVLLYNFYPEYIPAAFVLKVLGNTAYLDIEDAPRIDEMGMRGVVNRLSYSILKLLCKKECIVAAKGIAKQLNLLNTLAIYGTITKKEEKYCGRDFNRSELCIMYGGTISYDTGLDLFIQTIKQLDLKLALGLKRIRFVITGFGGESELVDLRNSISNSSIILDIKSNLSASEYRYELEQAQAALCLKLPHSEMGATTFPSKVVEIASAGLLLFSTKVSDVPLLFDENSAILLDEASPEELCSALMNFVDNAAMYEKISRNGHKAMINHLSAETVGKKLSLFLGIQ